MPNSAKSCLSHKRRGIPLSILLLGGWIAALGAVNVIRVIQAIQLADFIISLGLSLPPYLLIGVSAVWALVFLACALGLWRLRSWARRATVIAVPLYELALLAGRALFARSDYARQAWPSALIWAGVTILLTWVLLSLPGARRAFR